jgi:biopolymer transport protein TolQ
MGYPAPASYDATCFRHSLSATVKEEVMMSPFHIAVFFLLQGDDGAVPVAHSPTSGFSAVIDMVRNSGPVAIAVLVLLLIASLYSWAVILGKSTVFRRARNQSRRFMRAFRKADRLQEISAVSDQFKPSPLVTVFDEVYDTYRRQTGGFGPPKNIVTLERAAQAASSESLTVLERRLTWLATIGAVAPFVGLFGTVMGIVDAFHGLGTEGAATLRAVAPGVSEALITTAAGLLVAIPAVIAYNQFTASLREFASRMDDFSRELLNSLEEITPKQEAMEREAASGLHR